MPHVDEGLLHAYLDGALDALAEAGALPHGTTRQSIEAHIAVCADCRALLDAERALRTRAGAVLDAAAPVVVVPPFNELFGAQRVRRPRRRVWPLAWAASLLLAVGAGWWANMLVNQRESLSVAEPYRALSSDANMSAEPQRANTATDTRGSAGAVAEPAAAPAAPPAVPETGGASAFRDAANTRGEADARRERAESANELRATSPPAVQGAQVGAEGARVASSEVARRAGSADSGRAAGAPLGRTLAATADVSAVARSDRAAVVAQAPPPPPPRVAAPPPAAVVTITGANPEDANIQQFRRALTELDAGGLAFTTAPPRAELPSLQLEGGSAPTVQWSSVLGGSIARITQRAPNGVAVELIVWRQQAIALDEIVVSGAQRRERDSAAARNPPRARTEAEVAQAKALNQVSFAHTRVAEATLPDGRRELLLRSADGTSVVALRAAVSAAELQALATRLVQLRQD